MKIESHILDRDGNCSRCGFKLGGIALTGDGKRAPIVGDRIGAITDMKFSETSAYLIQATQFDSNKLCAPKLK